MRSIMLAAAAALALSSGAALAAGGNVPGNSTSTSMGAPAESPNYAAPRSGVVPGLPNQERDAQASGNGVARQQMVEKGKIPQAPRSPVTGHAQTNP
jgi:hypothetical protein